MFLKNPCRGVTFRPVATPLIWGKRCRISVCTHHIHRCKHERISVNTLKYNYMNHYFSSHSSLISKIRVTLRAFSHEGEIKRFSLTVLCLYLLWRHQTFPSCSCSLELRQRLPSPVLPSFLPPLTPGHPGRPRGAQGRFLLGN